MTTLTAWMYFLSGAGGAGLLFWAGTRLSNRTARVRIFAAVVFGFIFAFAAVSHLTSLQDHTYRIWMSVRGEDFIALLSAQMILGLSHGWLSRRIQKLTVVVMAVVLWFLLLMVAISPLVWLYGGAAALNGLPDKHGILKQFTPFTCAPAAASMLLNRYSIDATEGELALASRTSILFGTNDYALADAIHKRASIANRVVRVMLGSAKESRDFPIPFIAGVNHPKWGSHEILIERFDSKAVYIIDPYEGKRDSFSLNQWESMWQGRAIIILPATLK